MLEVVATRNVRALRVIRTIGETSENRGVLYGIVYLNEEGQKAESLKKTGLDT